MKLEEGKLSFGATDLSNFSACHHKTLLEREVAQGRLKRPQYTDPGTQLLEERGREHEARYREQLETRHGQAAFQVPGGIPQSADDWRAATERTLAAMQAGHHIIYQAPLARGDWHGIADFLLRVDVARDEAAHSALGDYHYEVVDTKLSQEARGSALLQLCVYTELVALLQDKRPSHFHLASPAGATRFGQVPKPQERTFRVADYGAYFRLIRQHLTKFALEVDIAEVYPEPVEHCEVCAWWQRCDARRREDDHLSLVAGMGRGHRRLLEQSSVTTLTELGQLRLPLSGNPAKIPKKSLERLHHQARLQLAAKSAPPVFELLEVESGRGLSLLPEPNPGDLFFDIEADRYASDGTFHYLLGWVELGDAGTHHYQGHWAETRAEERANFERFIDMVVARRARYPEMHIYHFASFEKTALGEMMGRYASREESVDELFRGEVLVDLLPVVKQALRAGVESYSLKDLEQFFGFARGTDLRAASRARRLFELHRESGLASDLPEVAAKIEAYNLEDCVSTAGLRDWLEVLRSGLLKEGAPLLRPAHKEESASEQVSAWVQRVRALRERLTAGLPKDPEYPTAGEEARFLLANVLDWHRREAKPGWWEYFRVRGLAEPEFIEDAATLGALGPERDLGKEPGTRSRRYEYSFPAQEFKLKPGDKVECPITDQVVGEVLEVQHAEGLIAVKRTQPLEHPPRALSEKNSDPPHRALQDALAEIADSLAGDFGLPEQDDFFTGIAEVSFPAARSLLLRSSPQLKNKAALQQAGESETEALCRVAPLLVGSVLPVQGPPGSGKTYSGSRMIVELVRKKKKVGIVAQSHAVIENLLAGVHLAAAEVGQEVFSIQKPKSGEQAWAHPHNKGAAKTPQLKDALLRGGAQVAAGTAWLWCDPQMRSSVDVLVIDEAGQFSLANTLAVSVAADSLVLLGDPQQLAQPSKGSHPPGAERSALEHLLDGEETIPVGRGLFLEQTWRLPPAIARFTSECFYAGRLSSQEGCARQTLTVPGSLLSGTGLLFAPVRHSGNIHSSDEEATRIKQLAVELLSGGASWTDRTGQERPLTPSDLLVVAPYNLQVNLLQQTLAAAGFPQVRVGTVDKFQGQQAPVVIYSMATSHPEDAPRGFDFLFSLNRLNVATSRAQARVIIVGSPRLLEADCKTPQQMKLVNGFCAAVEVSRTDDDAALM